MQLFEGQRKIEQEKQQKLAAAERREAKELHFMKCPTCEGVWRSIVVGALVRAVEVGKIRSPLKKQ